jgi:hypothetical protein
LFAEAVVTQVEVCYVCIFLKLKINTALKTFINPQIEYGFASTNRENTVGITYVLVPEAGR